MGNRNPKGDVDRGIQHHAKRARRELEQLLRLTGRPRDKDLKRFQAELHRFVGVLGRVPTFQRENDESTEEPKATEVRATRREERRSRREEGGG